MENKPSNAVTLPPEVVEELEPHAKRMGMSVAGYVSYMNQLLQGRLDRKAQDAARFMFTKHAESLRKLAQ
jgi:uncharacterized protein (DUF302 family)